MKSNLSLFSFMIFLLFVLFKISLPIPTKVIFSCYLPKLFLFCLSIGSTVYLELIYVGNVL